MDRLLDRYWTSYWIVLAFLLGIFTLLLDNEPPGFPLDPRLRHSIDCYNIHVKEFSTEASRIRVQFKADFFVQFPVGFARYLLHVTTNVSNNSLRFDPLHFWDLTPIGDEVRFTILQTIQGNVTAVVYCDELALGAADMRILDIPFYPIGWSRLFASPFYLAEFTDFCFYEGSIVYGAAQSGHINAFNLTTAYPQNIEFDVRRAEDFRNAVPGAASVANTSIFIAANPRSLFETLLDVVIPVFAAIERNASNSLFLINNQTDLLPNLKPFKLNVELYNSSERRCFIRGRFIRSSNSSSPFVAPTIDQLRFVLSVFSNFSINEMRSTFASTKPTEGKTICDAVSKREGGISCEEIPTVADLSRLADIVASSSSFVVSGIDSLLFALFMHPNTTVLLLNKSLSGLASKICKITGARFQIGSFVGQGTV
jgi:hypothetical protein